MATIDNLDAAVSAHSAHIRNRDGLASSPVLAWVAIAVTDDDGDQEASFVVITPDGQRGAMTRGIVLDALDALRIAPRS